MREPDLSKLVFYSGTNAFKNNAVYTGSYAISGTTTEGINIIQPATAIQIDSDVDIDIAEIVANGPVNNLYDPRPADAWFKDGSVWTVGNDPGAGYIDYPVELKVSIVIINIIPGIIDQPLINLQFVWSQQFVASLVLTPISVSYKVIDSSVF